MSHRKTIEEYKVYAGDIDSVEEWLSIKKKGFNGIDGNFNCSGEDLNSLKGCPEYVSGDFYCYDNKLVTLAHSPKYIGGLFDFSDNKIGRINIDNFPEFIGGAVFCAGNCVAIDKFNNRNRIEVLNELKKEKEDKELISFIDKEASKITKASRMKL